VNKLVRNEQAKLTATYINGLAIGIFAVGAFAPVANFAAAGQAGGWPLFLLVVGCLLSSVALHYVARWMLRKLEE
jgi:hypothetical protein